MYTQNVNDNNNDNYMCYIRFPKMQLNYMVATSFARNHYVAMWEMEFATRTVFVVIQHYYCKLAIIPSIFFSHSKKNSDDNHRA